MSAPSPPEVSLLLPCKDADEWLDEAISSLEAQTEPRWEALTLDDGSADATPDILGAWAERDARVRLLRREGRGLIDALRTLSAEARAPLIARMDADDVAHPRRLEAQIAWLRERPRAAGCGTGVRYVPRPTPGSGYARYETWLNSLREPEEVARDLYVECPIAHPTLMVRREAFASVGGYRRVDGPEDYDLVLRLAGSGFPLGNVPEVLLDWRRGPRRLSERSRRYGPDAFRALKIAYLRSEVPPRGRPLVIWGAGRVGKAFARAWLAQGDRAPPVSAFVDLDPRKIAQTIHDAPVIAPPDLASVGESAAAPYTLLAVGSPGARDEIRTALVEMGFREIDDFRAVA